MLGAMRQLWHCAASVVTMWLLPLAMMTDNPYGLDLATPSIALHADDLEAARAQLVDRGVTAMEIGEHSGVRSFAFSDPEGRWFAVTG